MTGKCEPACWWLGVKTLRNRQSSEVLAWPKGPASCGQWGANCVAGRTPDQLAAGCGGCHRSGPTGGAAYGMPRNSSTAPLARPRTAPLAVAASGPLAACPPRVLALTAGAAATRAPRVTPATAIRVRARHPAQIMDIQVSLRLRGRTGPLSKVRIGTLGLRQLPYARDRHRARGHPGQDARGNARSSPRQEPPAAVGGARLAT